MKTFIDDLEEYLKNTPKEEVAAAWERTKKYDECSVLFEDLITLSPLKQGDKVTYNNGFSIEKGVVKEVVNENMTRVVYHCNEEWDRYMDYTSALTDNQYLTKGWE